MAMPLRLDTRGGSPACPNQEADTDMMCKDITHQKTLKKCEWCWRAVGNVLG